MVVFIKCLNCLLVTLRTYGLGSITQGFLVPSGYLEQDLKSQVLLVGRCRIYH